MQKVKQIGLATVFSLAVFTAQAELLPEVSEARTRTPSNAPQLTANPDNYEMVQQLQWVQEELQTMRGMLEENQHTLEQLNTRQRDLYADLDQRILEIRQDLAENTETATPKPRAAEPLAAVIAEEELVVVTVSNNKEQDAYQAAYDLLQSQRYAAAIDAFDAYLLDNPEGQYTANAYYWLGESHVIYDDLAKAEEAFSTVIEQYPLHQKAADAMLKLGYVYDAAGEPDKAIATLTEAKQKYPNSSVSRLADQRIVQIKQNM